MAIAPIPAAPAAVVVGIPADLLRRRPDVCRAERLAAAQAEQIGIAEADLYPIFKINGNMGYSAAGLSQLFESNAFYGAIGPGVQWNILNYGRIRNNMRCKDAKFQELVTLYQRMVLQAAEEAEDGMSHFVQEQDRSKLLDESVSSLQLAVNTVVKQYEAGGIDFTRVSQIEQRPRPATRRPGRFAWPSGPRTDRSLPCPGRRLASSRLCGPAGAGRAAANGSVAGRSSHTAPRCAPADATVGSVSE